MHKLILTFSLLALATTAGIADTPGTPADIYNHQPVGPTLSTDDANGYVDNVVTTWLAFKLPNRNPQISPEELMELATAVKRLGVPNLIAAYSKTAPDNSYRKTEKINPQDEIKRSILEKALSLTAGASDLDALLGLYDSRPLILNVLKDHPEWDNDPRVSDFLSTHLDQLADAYTKSDRAPTTLLTLAARSPVPDVQTKLDSIIADATQNDLSYRNKQLYINLITVYFATANRSIHKRMPDIFTVLANRAKVTPSDIYNDVTPEAIFIQLQWVLQWDKLGNMATTTSLLFSDPKTKDAIIKLAGIAEDNGSQEARVLVPAAACGNLPALKKLADLYHSLGSNAGANSSPGIATMERNLATKYLETVICQRNGDKMNQITDHVSTAVYDPTTCTWTIPRG